MLKHIALEVKESDVQDFYSEILGGSVYSQFTLNEGDTENLFQLSRPIEVYKLKLTELQLELFIHDSIDADSLKHLCLKVKNAKEVFTKAKEMGYWNRMRTTEIGDTYFIRDRNRNMFELKTN